jgi:hypothetical protein
MKRGNVRGRITDEKKEWREIDVWDEENERKDRDKG